MRAYPKEKRGTNFLADGAKKKQDGGVAFLEGHEEKYQTRASTTIWLGGRQGSVGLGGRSGGGKGASVLKKGHRSGRKDAAWQCREPLIKALLGRKVLKRIPHETSSGQ